MKENVYPMASSLLAMGKWRSDIYFECEGKFEMKAERYARLAVLIDAENTSARVADGLFNKIARIGETSLRRVYGDFSGTRLKPWADIMFDHAMTPQMHMSTAGGKNASDIALVVDAMDMLHTGRFDGFCIISSDSDFTRLASRIREQGLDVFGFGEKKTPESFRRVCSRFIQTEGLMPAQPANQPVTPKEPLQQPPSKAVPLLRKAIVQAESDDGWANLGEVGSRLANLAPDFDPRSYGFSKLSDLVRKTNCFDFAHPESGAIRIRLRAQKPAAVKNLKAVG